MHRSLWAGLALAFLSVLVLTRPSPALVVAAAPVPDRVATADIVVVGKITAIEDKTVMAKRFPGAPEKTEFKVALVQIADPLKGAKGLTIVRLGFVPPVVQPAPQPGVPRIGGGFNRFPQLNHQVGQEALFFLTKSADGDFHLAQNYFDVVEKKSGNFEQEVTLAKRAAKLLEDPMTGLKSKDADDRLTTASLLLTKYRTPKLGVNNPKMEAVPAEESKLILEAIAGGDWTRQGRAQVSPQMVIQRLNLTAKDGWNPPKFKDYQKEFPAYAQQWLKANTGKYQVQRFIP